MEAYEMSGCVSYSGEIRGGCFTFAFEQSAKNFLESFSGPEYGKLELWQDPRTKGWIVTQCLKQIVRKERTFGQSKETSKAANNNGADTTAAANSEG